MAWLIWIGVGLALLLVEVLAPTDFFLFFLGLAALFTGGGAYAGLLPAPWMQIAAFAVAAVALLRFVRKPLAQRWVSQTEPSDRIGRLIGESVVLSEDLEPGGVAKAELRGSTWSVRSEHDTAIQKGTRCNIERAEGLVLWVSPELRSGANEKGDRT